MNTFFHALSQAYVYSPPALPSGDIPLRTDFRSKRRGGGVIAEKDDTDHEFGVFPKADPAVLTGRGRS